MSSSATLYMLALTRWGPTNIFSRDIDMQALSGVRVLDLTHVIAGPFCTHQLGVQGAEVIKIEDLNSPDMVRADGADMESNKNGMGTVFTAQAANKKAIAIDLKQPKGQEILKQLVKDADVLVENFRSGALGSLGLGYADLSLINPALIYCSMTGFGQTGPKRHHTAYDNVIQAFSGLMAATGTEQTGPIKVGPPVLDYGTGAQAAFAIVSALFRRSQTGEGQYIDISMLDSALMLMGNLITENHATGQPIAPHGNHSPNRPGYGCFNTADGLLVIGAWTTTQLKNLWIALENSTEADAVTDAHPTELMDRFDTTIEKIQQTLMSKSAKDWEHILNQNKVPAARVRNVQEALNEEQLRERNVIGILEQENSPGHFPNASFKYSNHSPNVRTNPPSFGQHTREILTEAGYSFDEIDSLQTDRIISCSIE